MKFGVEFEFTAAVANAIHSEYGSFYDHLLSQLRGCGLGNWRLDNDASCGNEIVSPILDSERGPAQLKQVCYCVERSRVLFGLSRVIGVDCGLHFHFEAKSLPTRAIKNVLVTMAVAETLLYAMNPLSRFSTAFAAPLAFNLFQVFRARDVIDLRDAWFRSYMGVVAQADSFRNKVHSYQPPFINSEKQPQKYDWTRYHGLNLVALFKHGTIEYRYPQGTFDPETVKHWYDLFLGIMQMSIDKKTRLILKHYPYDMSFIKNNSIARMQMACYNNLGVVLAFLFGERKTKFGPTRLLQPTVPQLKFIAQRLMKYTPGCINTDKFIAMMEYPEAENPDGLLEMLVRDQITVSHSRYVVIPPADPIDDPRAPRNEEFIEDQPQRIVPARNHAG